MDQMRCAFITRSPGPPFRSRESTRPRLRVVRLCALFEVEQREAQRAWRGETLADAGATTTQMFSRLWDQLVPDSGQCKNATGRGLSALRGGLATRCSITAASFGIVLLREAAGSVSACCRVRRSAAMILCPRRAAVASLKGRSAHQAVDDITELAVEWVRLKTRS